MTSPQPQSKDGSKHLESKKKAFHVILLLGVVSLFGDITYEGARSVAGPYLALLGASAAAVGFVAGIGEFVGYALRLVAGYFADRTRAYWPLTMIGYGLLIAVPLLAFAGSWHIAALLIIAERLGKAIRSPARDAILSHATAQVGRGLGFGIHEAIDQIGAIIGPLIFSAIFFMKKGYSEGFSLLWIPALLTMAVLIVARIKVPQPDRLEVTAHQAQKGNPFRSMSKVFWLYILFIVLSVAGFTNFQLIAYHFKMHSVVSESSIPLFYAIAMAVDAAVALIVGRAYDKIGLRALITIPLLTLPIPLVAFSHSYGLAMISAALWGMVMGIHETIMRAAIADITEIEHRGFAYGTFNTAYGIAWFIGGTVLGALYDSSIHSLLLFVVVMELASIPVFFLVKREVLRERARLP